MGGTGAAPRRSSGAGAAPTTTTALATSPAHLLLLTWLSPAFPVGAFAYSHGLEAAVARGWIDGRAGLAAWLRDLVQAGSVRNDLVLAAEAMRAAAAHDTTALADVVELGAAMQPSAARHLEATQQGQAFLAAVEAAWPSPALAALLAPLGAKGLATAAGAPAIHAVAFAIAAAAHAVPPRPALEALAHAFLANLVSAAIRLSVIGQTDGQILLAELMPAVADAADRALTSTLADLGTATLRSDLATLRHETLYSRIFRS